MRDIFLLKRDCFPLRIRIYSGKDNSLLWDHTIATPGPVDVPGFEDTGHTPVEVRVDYGDGTYVDTREEIYELEKT